MSHVVTNLWTMNVQIANYFRFKPFTVRSVLLPFFRVPCELDLNIIIWDLPVVFENESEIRHLRHIDQKNDLIVTYLISQPL